MKNSLVLLSAIVLHVTTVAGAFGQAGSLDITFNPGTGANDLVVCIGVHTNGQILIGGNFGSVNGSTRHYIARLNAYGGLDGSFDPGDGPNGLVGSLAVQPDGKVIIGGAFSFVNGLNRPGIARLRADGSLDLSFNPVSGPSGSMLVLQTNGQILVTGGNGPSIARLNADGLVDPAFDPGSGASGGPVVCVAVQPDGKMLVGGAFTSFNGIVRKYVARLNSNGSLDDGFMPDQIIGTGFSYVIRCMVVQGDGRILIGGSFQTINGYTRHNVARLNADGSLDLTFTSGSGVSDNVFALALQPDGKVVVGGTFTGVNGVTQNRIARLNGDGSLDTTFNSGSGANSDVLAVALQPDGKVLLGGTFSGFNGTNINRIARINGDVSPLAGLQFLNANHYFGGYLSGTVSNTYRVEWTTNLNASALWTPLFNLTLQTNPQFILDPTPITGRERYYRAVSLP
jgi:uncharacterized delta-60 repeat protein